MARSHHKYLQVPSLFLQTGGSRREELPSCWALLCPLSWPCHGKMLNHGTLEVLSGSAASVCAWLGMPQIQAAG